MPLPGDPLYLRLQLDNGATGKFVRAHVYDSTGTEILGSPASLADVGNGLYSYNGGLQMPNSPVAWVQMLVYDDAGFTQLDPRAGIGTDSYSAYGMNNAAAIGDKLFPWLQCADGNAITFVRAHLFDATGTEIPGSPVNLVYKGNGLYLDPGTLLMPNTPFLTIEYLTFQDSAYTEPSTVESDGIDLIFRTQAAVVINQLSNQILRGGGNLSGILKG